MNLKRFGNSLFARIILFGLLLVVLGGITRYYFQARFLREDLTQLVSSQQTALAQAVAQDIDTKIQDRLRLLERLALTLPPALLDQPEALQAWLAERYQLNPVFSLGVLVVDTRGHVLADYPKVAGRAGSSIADNPDFVRVARGESGVGRPRLGPFTRQSILPMGVPLKSPDGRVHAVLLGITALGAPGFLDRISHGRIGESGGFLLISPVDKLFVAAGDPELVLKPTPAPGINLLHDQAMAGFRGSGITRNAKGIEELSSIVGVPSTGWFVVARLPTAEAFAPVRRAQDVVIRHSVTALLLVLLVVGFMVRVMLGPLKNAAALADGMTHGEIPMRPLPVVRDDEVGRLTTAFNQLLDKLARSQVKLERMAHHDELTGLPNRVLLADRMHQGLARARRNGLRIAVLYLDLDGFKPINDSLGHGVGDEALVEVARRLSSVLRQSDTLARVGGDEFVLLVTDLTRDDEGHLAALADRCIDTLSLPLRLRDTSCTLGASIGIALSEADDEPEAVLQAADRAMYEAKQAGRGRYATAPGARTPQAPARPFIRA